MIIFPGAEQPVIVNRNPNDVSPKRSSDGTGETGLVQVPEAQRP